MSDWDTDDEFERQRTQEAVGIIRRLDEHPHDAQALADRDAFLARGAAEHQTYQRTLAALGLAQTKFKKDRRNLSVLLTLVVAGSMLFAWQPLKLMVLADFQTGDDAMEVVLASGDAVFLDASSAIADETDVGMGLVPDGRVPMVHPITRYHTDLWYEAGVFDYVPWPLDFEKIASLTPDLILARDWELAFFDQLSKIAPTVLIDMSPGIEDISAQVAEAINAEEARSELHARFLERAAEVEAALGDLRGREVAFLTVLYFDELRIADRFHAMSEAMDRVGLKPARSVRAFIEDIHGPGTTRHRATLSPERIDLADVDLLLLPYWASATDLALEPDEVDHEGIVDDVHARLDEKVPGFCAFLRVCQSGQMIVFEATPTYTPTYSGMMSALDFIEREIVGRTLEPIVSD